MFIILDTTGTTHTHSIHEPSHGRGAKKTTEPLTLGAQDVTRYNALKNSVRATRDRRLYELVPKIESASNP